MKGEIESADAALALIGDKVAQGLTPVMHGTRFYRYNFSKSQFSSFIWYLDERGTRGCCQFQNVEKVFDFIDLGRPVSGNLPETQGLRVAPMTVVVEVVRQARAPSLLEAAVAALEAMDAAGVVGSARDDLAQAIAKEGTWRP
jgi:hypothetical protein